MLSKAVHDARSRHGYVTATELASRCGVHRTTVAVAIRLGRLKCRQVGNVFLVAKSDADAFASKYKLTKTATKKKPART